MRPPEGQIASWQDLYLVTELLDSDLHQVCHPTPSRPPGPHLAPHLMPSGPHLTLHRLPSRWSSQSRS
eukprot:scaffold89500_cov57-Phaeocystis_antarctica.AAC.2